MRNNVVLAIAVWFQRLKITTLRFNFGGSQFGRGHHQVDQVREAANFLLTGQHLQGKTSSSASKSKEATSPKTENSMSPKYILLVGYSYGSIISASASANIPQCVGTVMISPPLAVRHWLYMFSGNYHLEQARRRGVPLLMMIGSKDNFTAENAFMNVVNTMPQNSTTGAVLKEADHFFRGREKDLMDIMGEKLERPIDLTDDISFPKKLEPSRDIKRVPFIVSNVSHNLWYYLFCNLLSCFSFQKGHWILNVFPQCNNDLNSLASAELSIFESPTLDSQTFSESYTGCW